MAYVMAPQQAVMMTTTTANNTGMPNVKQGAWCVPGAQGFYHRRPLTHSHPARSPNRSTDLLDCFAAPGGAGAGASPPSWPGSCTPTHTVSYSSTAFYACFCSPCAYGDMAAIAPPDSIMFAGNCYLAGCCFMMMPHLFLCASQQGLRTAFNIQGSCVGDACSACLCPVCALLQQNRECLIRQAQPQVQMQNPVVMMQQPQQVMMVQQAQPQMVMMQAQPQMMYVQK